MDTPIPIDFDIQYMKCEDDDRIFAITLQIIGTAEPQLDCWIRTKSRAHAQVEHVWRDQFNLPVDLRDRFIQTLYNRLLGRYLQDSPTRIEYREPDLRPWIERCFYHADATRLTRCLAAKVDPAADHPKRQRIMVTE